MQCLDVIGPYWHSHRSIANLCDVVSHSHFPRWRCRKQRCNIIATVCGCFVSTTLPTTEDTSSPSSTSNRASTGTRSCSRRPACTPPCDTCRRPTTPVVCRGTRRVATLRSRRRPPPVIDVASNDRQRSRCSRLSTSVRELKSDWRSRSYSRHWNVRFITP